MIGWIIGGLVVLIIIIFIAYYNRFATLGNRIDNSLAQIDVQLKKRADLVPNLMETVKGYAKYEKSVLTAVTSARTAFLKATDMPSKVKAGDKLQSALKTIFAVSENYPNLRANENFLHLQQELSAIEDKVAYARQYYNDSIMDYNNSSRTFPGKLFFNMFGFKEKPYLEIAASERVVPKVNFSELD
ncbi:MAG: LemA family protein [Candidatus Pacearchaeota archaeon]